MTRANANPVSRRTDIRRSSPISAYRSSLARRTLTRTGKRARAEQPDGMWQAAPRGRCYWCCPARRRPSHMSTSSPPGRPLMLNVRGRLTQFGSCAIAWRSPRVSVIDRTPRDEAASRSDVRIQSDGGDPRAWTVKLTQIGWLGAALLPGPLKLLCRSGMGAARSS